MSVLVEQQLADLAGRVDVQFFEFVATFLGHVLERRGADETQAQLEAFLHEQRVEQRVKSLFGAEDGNQMIDRRRRTPGLVHLPPIRQKSVRSWMLTPCCL